MIVWINVLGWITHGLLAYAFLDGAGARSSGDPAEINRHLTISFLLLFPVFYLHTVPLVQVVGLTRELERRFRTVEAHEPERLAALSLRRAMIIPSVVATLLGLLGASCGLLQAREDLPRGSHFLVQCVFVLSHVWAWRRYLAVFALLEVLRHRARDESPDVSAN